MDQPPPTYPPSWIRLQVSCNPRRNWSLLKIPRDRLSAPRIATNRCPSVSGSCSLEKYVTGSQESPKHVIIWLLVEPTHLENMNSSNCIIHFPRDRGEHEKYLSCHHLVRIPKMNECPPKKGKKLRASVCIKRKKTSCCLEIAARAECPSTLKPFKVGIQMTSQKWRFLPGPFVEGKFEASDRTCCKCSTEKTFQKPKLNFIRYFTYLNSRHFLPRIFSNYLLFSGGNRSPKIMFHHPMEVRLDGEVLH